MGLLDDAIREHLDLKRRRGADPAEVARLEQEALGPVRREPAAAEDAPVAPAADTPLAAEGHHEPEPAHDPVPEPHRAEHPHPVEAREHPDSATHALAPGERHDPPHGDPLRERREDSVLQPTTEYRVEDHHDAEDEHGGHEPRAGEEDVLEETPDFLQETPEHDRLWFEQRPPRDFDFDG